MTLRKIADTFSKEVVSGNYSIAHKMLSESLAQQWTIESIKEEYETMVEYFEDSKPSVVENFSDEYSETKIDDATLLYVPIQNECGESEAILLTFDLASQIIGLEFGRP